MQPTIDFQLANSILDTLGYTLRDISLEHGDILIMNGDVSHQLFWENTLLGYVWTWGECYHTSLNYSSRITPELAALDLLPKHEIEMAINVIQSRRALVPEYF